MHAIASKKWTKEKPDVWISLQAANEKSDSIDKSIEEQQLLVEVASQRKTITELEDRIAIAIEQLEKSGDNDSSRAN